MITLAVDAMGGDIGLDVTLPGAKSFLEKVPDAHLILVGDRTSIEQKLANEYPVASDRVTICHSKEHVAMDDNPFSALRNKRHSSMRLAIDLVESREAKAAVSAGNTGALIAISKHVLKTLPGIERPAIAKFLPGYKDKRVCALDLGANINCSPIHLLQFALLGSELKKATEPGSDPRIGLMNIGVERIKGNEMARKAFELFEKTAQNGGFNFIGNVEGTDLFNGKADVIVCDGFVGNIMLKTMEGAMRFVTSMIKSEFNRNLPSKMVAGMAKPIFARIQKELDPRYFNGANILGLNGIIVKSHGGTDAFGFSYALQETYQEALNTDLDQLRQVVGESLARNSAFIETT